MLVEDNRDWYPKVRELLDNPDLYNTILKNAQELVEREYNIETNYIYWQRALEEVARR